MLFMSLMVPLAFALLVALPWAASPEPPPKGVQLVLTQPDYPFPLPADLVIDIASPRELPFNARSTDEKISTRPLPNGAPVPADGLVALRMSGSGQFCQNQFWALQETLTPDRQVTVVDLRAEPHGFINNMAVSWGPLGRLPAEPATQLERRWLAAARSTSRATATAFALDGYTNSADWESIDLRINVRETSTEDRFVRRVTWGYRRFDTLDFTAPTDAVVDEFVDFISSRDASTWLHLHCDTGLGRTTTFMTLVDMMANSGRASASALIERQHRLGGSDLANTSDSNRVSATGKRDRLDFVENFYRYCRQSAPNFRQSWSAWKRNDARADRFNPAPGTPDQPPPVPPSEKKKPFRRR